MEKSKHIILKLLAKMYSNCVFTEKTLIQIEKALNEYSLITSIHCVDCNELLYELNNKLICLKCNKIIDKIV